MTKRIKAMLDEAQLNTRNWSLGLMSYFPPVLDDCKEKSIIKVYDKSTKSK